MNKTPATIDASAAGLLQWQSVPQSLPPDPDGGWFSPCVWLALSDGTVEQGQCLHKSADAGYAAPVHDWFLNHVSLRAARGKGVKVIAWMPFAKPDHPNPSDIRIGMMAADALGCG